MICWKCKEAIQSPVCVGCGAIQPPPPNPDYFVIFDLPRSFFIDDVSINDCSWTFEEEKLSGIFCVGCE